MSDFACVDQESVASLTQAGVAAYREGDFSRAADCFTSVLRLDPTDNAARINLANAYWSAGALDEAAKFAQTALTNALSAGPAKARAENSRQFEAWMITGAIKLARGDAHGAVSAYGAATTCRPGSAAGYAGLAAALLTLGDAVDAEAQADVALALDPDCLHAQSTRAASLAAQADYHGAIAAYDALLAAHPDDPTCWLNRGAAMLDLDHLTAADHDLAMATALDPTNFAAWVTRGYAACLAGRLDEAVNCADRALSLDPDHPQAHWNRGIALLLKGDYPAGFTAYEWRKRHPVHGRSFTPMPAPLWQGEGGAGQRLLVRAEQGMGDTIMFARFLPVLVARGLSVTLACAPVLHRLLSALPAKLIDLEAVADHGCFDYALDQMSLPLALGLTPSAIQAAGGYLTADPGLVATAQAWLSRHTVPGQARIGFVWAGNPAHDNDRRRSLPPGALAPLLARRHFNAIALQMGPQRGAYPIPDAMSLVRDYADTAAIIAQLDAVVTIDSSVAHLAGALGVPCHILLSSACDWRWGITGTDSPWYHAMRLHRQRLLGDWSGPLESVAAALA